MNPLGRALASLAVVGAIACSSPPFGEVLVVVDTDVPVPALAANLRVDLYAPDGTWYRSQEFPAFRAEDWPLSFGLSTDDPAGGSVRLRLRTFPESGLRDYRGERFPAFAPFVEPPTESSLESLCADAPLVALGVEHTQRRGLDIVTAPTAQADCVAHATGGATAFRVQIDEAARYRVEIVRAVPNGASQIPGGDTMLFVRSDCRVPASQLACNDDIDQPSGNFLSRLEVDLAPGSYTILTTTRSVLSPADVTVRVARADHWDTPSTGGALAPVPPAVPRLVAGGIDLTPPDEPQPNLAIDRLVDVPLAYGARRTLHVTLAGECLGTQADLAGGQTCVDTAGLRTAVPLAVPTDGIDGNHGVGLRGPSLLGTWAAAQPVPCTDPPRPAPTGSDGTPLHDDEVCIPGGVFTLGSLENIGGGERNTTPQQVAVVAPFLLDRFEVTVGRYRQALRDGFTAPLGGEPLDNPGRLAPSGETASLCTFSGDGSGPARGIDRETMPLSCIGWYGARAFCQFLGGDLPTHVEWEYAATAAGRERKTVYPWGDDAPDCQRAVYGRTTGTVGVCPGAAPSPVDAAPWASGDVTPLGVVGMGGGVSEWTLDSFRAYADGCWWTHPLRDVGCREVDAPQRSIRGGAWNVPALTLRSSDLDPQPVSYPDGSFGFRCARHPASTPASTP